MEKTATKSALSPEVPRADDVLETAEMLRAANALVRTSQGILFLSNSICSAEVFAQEELKDLESSVSRLLTAYGNAYAALMARYSALSQREGEEKSRKKEVDKAFRS